MLRAFKKAMGEELFNKWIDASNKLESGEIGYEEYDKIMSNNNCTINFDGKNKKITVFDNNNKNVRIASFA